MPFSAVTIRPSGKMAMFAGLQQPQKPSISRPGVPQASGVS